jgi:DNA-directed RNA polymerase specialized sigma24 family protein
MASPVCKGAKKAIHWDSGDVAVNRNQKDWWAMLIDQRETWEGLRQIVFKVTPDRALHEDLIQEAFVHLWLREKQCPGQTRSWYFQSCRFFLQNYLRNGRSVDSR